MNLQNNIDPDQSGSSKAKPENNLPKGSSETTREARSTTEIRATFTPEILEELEEGLFESEEVQSEIISVEEIIKTTPAQIYLENIKVVDQIDFTDYVKHIQRLFPHLYKDLDFTFLGWFIGIIEGDGCFGQRIYTRLSKSAKSYGQTQSYLRLGIGFDQKDERLVKIIHKKLGFGRISTHNNVKVGKMYRLFVQKREEIECLLHLFNGNIVLPKRIAQFKKWINLAQTKNLCPPDFYFKTQRLKVSFDNAWLAGFIEAEGCFYSHYRKAKDNYKYALLNKVTIAQLDTHGEKRIFEKILILFKTNAKVHMRKDGVAHIELVSADARKLIVDYFSKYPLYGKKRISAFRWYRLLLMWKDIQEGILPSHITAEEAEDVCKLCKKVNEKFLNNKFLQAL